MTLRRSLLGTLAPPILIIVMCVLILELGVLIIFGEQPKFPRRVVSTDFGLRVNQPDAFYRHKSADGTWWFNINSRGLRADREYPYEKPPGTLRIVSLGDSFTVGYEVNGDETFSSVLEAELRKAGHSVEVLNTGVSGYSNAEALLYLKRELLKYDPDVVLLSFYANDLVDNRRSGLFDYREGKLIATADRYVPGGGLGDFLNTNVVFNWLSGYSNSFVIAKERLTQVVKREIVTQNLEYGANARDDDEKGPGAAGPVAHPSIGVAEVDTDGPTDGQALAVAILDRLYTTLHERGIPLVIQSIPIWVGADEPNLVETFPVEFFDTDRDGLYFAGLKDSLMPFIAAEPLYNRRSHWHWTAFSHRVSGEQLAKLMLEQGLVAPPSGTSERATPRNVSVR